MNIVYEVILVNGLVVRVLIGCIDWCYMKFDGKGCFFLSFLEVGLLSG